MSNPTRSLPSADPAVTPAAEHSTSVDPSVGRAVAGPPTVPGYDMLEEVGRGGMGVVYRARDTRLSRDVAVKVLQDRFLIGSAAAKRFVEEAQITGQLQHPGIPAVHELGTLPEGRPFLAMKLIKGDTLATLLDRRPLAERAGHGLNLVAVFEQVCQAVGYAHAHNVIHRDLKPANVMVGAFGEVQVMDWGLAKVLHSPPREQGSDPDATLVTEIHSLRDTDAETQAGSILGTPAFMPPEQAIGAIDQIDARSDVFGLGAVLCVVLTGRPPYIAESAEATRQLAAQAKLGDAFARLDGCGAEPDLVALCKRCLSADKAGRPADAGAVADAVHQLRAAADERARRAEVDAAAAAAKAGEERKRRRVLAVAATVLLLGVAGTTAGLIWADAARRDAKAAQQAEEEQKKLAQAKEAEAEAVTEFFRTSVFKAGRLQGEDGGLGHDVSLRDAITASLPALATRFKDQPLVEARLRMTLAATFLQLGDAKVAAEQCEVARALYTARKGPDDPDTLECTTVLANSYSDLGRHPEAQALNEKTLDVRKRVLGPDDPATLMSVSNLARSYLDFGRYDEALALWRETLAGYRRAFPPDHWRTLDCMRNIAMACTYLRRYPEALKQGQEALDGCQRALRPDHPLTLETLGTLAIVYTGLGQHSKALELKLEVLAAQKRVYPANHPLTLLTMNNVSVSYSALGEHAKAIDLIRDTVAQSEAALSPTHPDTLIAMWTQVEVLFAAGRSAEAVPVIDECIRRAAGVAVRSDLVPEVMGFRLRHFRAVNDPAGCRATAAMWEAQNRPAVADLLTAARMRAVAADLYAKANQPTEANADAEKAVAWLTKAVAAGHRDRSIEADPDLTFLRGRADFRKLVEPLPYVSPPPRPVK